MKEFWDKRYAESSYSYGTDANVYFKEKIDTLAAGKLLLVAEGEGRNAVYAAKNHWQVTAIDFSESGKEKALALANANHVSIEYIVTDVEKYEFPSNYFDAIGITYGHFEPVLRKKVYENCIKALKPGGYFIFEAFNKKQLANTSGGPKDIEMLLSEEVLREDFKSMKIISCEEMVTELKEGNYHVGKADIIRLFAQKI